MYIILYQINKLCQICSCVVSLCNWLTPRYICQPGSSFLLVLVGFDDRGFLDGHDGRLFKSHTQSCLSYKYIKRKKSSRKFSGKSQNKSLTVPWKNILLQRAWTKFRISHAPSVLFIIMKNELEKVGTKVLECFICYQDLLKSTRLFVPPGSPWLLI